MRRCLLALGFICTALLGLSWPTDLSAAERTAAERGKAALLSRAFSPALLSAGAFDTLWKQWGLKNKPADFELALRERYGLHEAPFDNHGRPMGFRETRGLLGKGVTNDCLLCHAGSIAGQSYIGLPNSSLDFQGLYEDLTAASAFPLELPYQLSNVRGTIEAVASVSFLMEMRDPDLNLRVPQKLGFRTDLCEDIPAWWHLKRKKTMYATGGVDARSVRSIMTFMLNPFTSGAEIKKEESRFGDIRAYLLTIEPPKYPFSIDTRQAAHGKEIFAQTCARCHGSYGPGGSYPNKVVPLETVRTDPTLAQGYSLKAAAHYLTSWFAREKSPEGASYFAYQGGYQAPPLDGIWATAPYLHNASVPTVYHLLNSKARPRIFTRTYRTGKEDYDPVKLGWKIAELARPADPKLPARERRKIYDTNILGRGNGGHTFGDKLSEEERMAVIEYLKTL